MPPQTHLRAAPPTTVLAARRQVRNRHPPRCPTRSTPHLPPGGGGGGILRNAALYFNSRPLPALAISGRCALWCNFSARAIATDIRSCRNMERSRRSLLRRAEPVETRSAPEPSAGLGIITVTQKGNACLSHTPCCCCCCSDESMSVCMSTAPQSLIGRASTPKRRPKKAVKIRQKIHAIITGASHVKLEKIVQWSRCELRGAKLQPEASTGHSSPFKPNGEETQSGIESATT